MNATPSLSRTAVLPPRLASACHGCDSRATRPEEDLEVELVSRLRAGDGRAYETLYRRYGGRMLAVARRFFSCQEDSADAVQDALLSAFRSIDTFAENARLWTWLYRIVVNACLTRLRAQSRRAALPLDALLPAFDESGSQAHPVEPWNRQVYAQVAQAETRAQVRACIDQLPEPYRTVLLLRDIEELDTEATARRMGTTAGAVKTRLHRARQALRALLEPLVCVA